MKVVQNDKNNDVWIGQPAYTEALLLKKFGMENAKPVKTTVDMSTRLVNSHSILAAITN